MIDEFIKKYNELVEAKQYDEVMNYCNQKLIALSGKKEFNDEERHYIATIYSNMIPFIDAESGIKCLDSAIYYVPNSAVLYYQRAELKESLSDFNGAIEDYSIVIENEPNPQAYGYRGNVKVRMNNIPGAIDDFKKILDFEPDNEDVKNGINSLVIQYAQDNNIPCLSCTLTTGEKVYRIVTDFGTFDIPNNDKE